MGGILYGAVQLLQTATLTYRNASDVVENIGTQFPASNVGDSWAGTVCKFPRVELGQIVAQFASSKTFNAIAIFNHNLHSSVVIAVEGSNNGSAWSTITSFSLTSQRQAVLLGSQTYSWVRLRLTSLGSQAAIPYIGEWWVTASVTPAADFALGTEVGRRWNNVRTVTSWGRPMKVAKTTEQFIDGATAEALSEAAYDELEAWADEVEGSGTPFLFLRNKDVLTEAWIAEYVADEIRAAQVGLAHFARVLLSIRELPFGKPVA